MSLYRQIRAAALGYFWLPCPSCGEHFSGEEWVQRTRARDHFSSLPTEVSHDADSGEPHVLGSQGICPACTYNGVGCRAHAAHHCYHLGCEAVDPPPAGQPYSMLTGVFVGTPVTGSPPLPS